MTHTWADTASMAPILAPEVVPVTGPAAALICTLQRDGWRVARAIKLVTEEDRVLDLHTDPPVVVGRLMEAAVRKWRWDNFN